jgi:hypothetical protein
MVIGYSNQQARRKSLSIVTELFLNNGYPREMIRTTIRNTSCITTTTLNEGGGLPEALQKFDFEIFVEMASPTSKQCS